MLVLGTCVFFSSTPTQKKIYGHSYCMPSLFIGRMKIMILKLFVIILSLG
jgi:hypothetical protein